MCDFPNVGQYEMVISKYEKTTFYETKKNKNKNKNKTKQKNREINMIISTAVVFSKRI